MRKVVESFTISQENSVFLNTNFANKSEKVDEILSNFREKNADFEQKIAEIEQKIADFEQEKDQILAQNLKKWREGDKKEREKAKKVALEIEVKKQQKEKNLHDNFLIIQTKFPNELEKCQIDKDFWDLALKINMIDDEAPFLTLGHRLNGITLKILSEKFLENKIEVKE